MPPEKKYAMFANVFIIIWNKDIPPIDKKQPSQNNVIWKVLYNQYENFVNKTWSTINTNFINSDKNAIQKALMKGNTL